MPDISEIFGNESLSYEEFSKRLSKEGMEFGDLAQLRRGYEDKILEIRCMSALERSLEKSGAKNIPLVTRLINMEGITADEEGVHGITEQLDALKESDPYLFESDKKPTLRAVFSGGSHNGDGADPEKMSDADYYKRVKLL